MRRGGKGRAPIVHNCTGGSDSAHVGDSGEKGSTRWRQAGERARRAGTVAVLARVASSRGALKVAKVGNGTDRYWI